VEKKLKNTIVQNRIKAHYYIIIYIQGLNTQSNQHHGTADRRSSFSVM